jgi:hypothetical protein
MRPVRTFDGSVDYTMKLGKIALDQNEEEGESAGTNVRQGQQGQAHQNAPVGMPVEQHLAPAEGETSVQQDQERRDIQRANSLSDWSGSHRPPPQRGPLSGGSAVNVAPEDDEETARLKSTLSRFVADEDLDHAVELVTAARRKRSDPSSGGSFDRRRRARDADPPPQHLVETTGDQPPPFEGHPRSGAMDASPGPGGFARRFPEAARLGPNDPSWT